MYKVLTLNNISKKGLKLLPSDFEVSDSFKDPQAILVRSADMHDMEIPESVLFVGRAGAGTNNIPIDKLTERGIVVCNTPGANANAVKELVAAALLLSSRKIIDGVNWVNDQDSETLETDVEKNKKRFVGPELVGKKLGVVGLGAIGVLVANMAQALGMKVYGFDPYLSIKNAWGLSSKVKRSKSVKNIFKNCDYVTLHLPYNEETKGYVSDELLENSKNLRLINLARGGLVDNQAIIDALKEGKLDSYVTDFPSAELVGVENVISIPHLGASTPESEENCAEMICSEMTDYLLDGNIQNSVNYPDLNAGPFRSTGRITIIHKNKPNMIAQITSILAKDNINIANLVNSSRDGYAYTIIDTDSTVSKTVKEDLYKIDGIIRIRILK